MENGCKARMEACIRKSTIPTFNYWKHAYGNPPSLLPSTIKVGESSDSQLTSSVPGLVSSLMDMSMTEISEENQISMIKTCMKKTRVLYLEVLSKRLSFSFQ
jgi:hypothetical protein